MVRKMVVLKEGMSSVLEEVLAHDEAQLQERLKADPGLLPIEDFGLAGPLLVIGRETSLPSGSVDLVGVARGGQLLVIEFKTGPQNTDFRSAFAQLLDYGSDLWGMSYEVFESAVPLRYFASASCPPDSSARNMGSLTEAARASWPDMSDEEVQGFRERVDAQLASGAFHYVLVAQRFTRTTEQTVRYLNAVMQGPRFYAVELIRFAGGALDAFEARTVLQPDRAQSSKGQSVSTNEAEFLNAIGDDGYRDALQQLFEACRGLGLRFDWGVVGPSIRLQTPDRAEPLTVAWLYPPGRAGWMGLRNLTLGFDTVSAKAVPSVHAALDRYVTGLAALPGSQNVKPQWLRGRELAPDAVTANLHRVIELFADLVGGVSGA